MQYIREEEDLFNISKICKVNTFHSYLFNISVYVPNVGIFSFRVYQRSLEAERTGANFEYDDG